METGYFEWPKKIVCFSFNNTIEAIEHRLTFNM